MITATTKALIINATAGSGKTTTVVDGINYAITGKLPSKYTPSDEQMAIFEWMETHISKSDANSLIFCAFNNSIANELKERITHGEASTLHSLGCAILRENKVKYKCVKGYKTTNLLMKYWSVDSFKDLSKDQLVIADDVKEVVKYCKDKLITENEVSDESIANLCIEREYEPASALSVIVPAVKYVLTEGSKLNESKGILAKKVMEIDWDDMIYLPARFHLTSNYSVMIIDESQDLSHAKLHLVLNQRCDTYIFVGDPNQAIYGFAGADTQSFASIAEAIPNHEVLPLSYTYRCGKAIVSEAKQIVGDAINAGPNNPAGEVVTVKDSEMNLEVGDLLVSRVNAPLMGIAWKLIKEKKPVKVMGRNIGKNLITLIKKLCGKTITDTAGLIVKVNGWRDKEIEKLSKLPFDTDSKKIMIEDQADCIIQIAAVEDTVDSVVSFIKDLFDDTDSETTMIRLSSIHRAKGLEANNVYFYNPSIVPHPMAKTDEARLQEHNLKFVAVTRAIHKLVYVTVDSPVKKPKAKKEKVVK